MRRLLSLLLAGSIAVIFAGTALAQIQSTAPLQSFQGTTSQMTAFFTVPDGWVVRWQAFRSMNVAVLAQDGSLVAGASGHRTAFFVPKGGTFRLEIDLDTLPPGMPSQPTPSDRGPSPFESTITGGNSNGNNNSTPNPGGPGNPNPGNPNGTNAPMQRPMIYADLANRPYTIEVVQANSLAAAGEQGMMPNFKVPAGVVLASGAPPSLPPPTTSPTSNILVPGGPASSPGMTGDQARAVVLIKGDHGEGTGFLVKNSDGPAIVTNIHVIADNPNIKVTTSTGALITVVSQKCASDRDLALLAIQDNGYNYLQMAPDISAVVQPGDDVITPGNSQGGEVMLNTMGKVLGIGPERIEISNPIFHGNSGGPVFHTKSGKVLGVVTEAMKVDISNDLDKTSFASRNSAISGDMRYFALRLDTVTDWVAIDPRSFRIETAFLNQFQDQSRRLDAYLNPPKEVANRMGGQSSSSEGGEKIYLSDEKIMRAEHNYQGQAGGDTAQHIESLRSLLFELQGVADLNMTQIENMNNFYPFDRERAREEMAYRKALKGELDSIANNIERLGHLPRTNN